MFEVVKHRQKLLLITGLSNMVKAIKQKQQQQKKKQSQNMKSNSNKNTKNTV
jgi:hypothetical protein